MKYKTIQIDCNNMSEKELNKTMKELLGFPDFYGMNWDAMIDCLSYMRYPHEQMTELTLEEDETLIIYCKNLPKAKFDIPIFIDVIDAVNEFRFTVKAARLRPVSDFGQKVTQHY